VERLVHGSVRNGDVAWAAQAELAASFELVVLNRPGFPPNPPEDHIDFEEHGRWVAERLRPGDHLCGHSYGALVSLFAAEAARELRSLILIEPPAFGVANDDPEVAAYANRQKAHWSAGSREPRAFLAGFYELAGRQLDLPDVLPADLLQGAQALIVQRGPWEAQPAFSRLTGRGIRTLVASGGWSPVFETVCDVVAERLGARASSTTERDTVCRTRRDSTKASWASCSDRVAAWASVHECPLSVRAAGTAQTDPRSALVPSTSAWLRNRRRLLLRTA
jgi:pimeloyl-ACP methyl ester carboxylesterase